MDVSDMCFDIEMVAGREEVHEEVCTYYITAFEEDGVEVAWESIKYHLEFEQGLRRIGVENVVSQILLECNNVNSTFLHLQEVNLNSRH